MPEESDEDDDSDEDRLKLRREFNLGRFCAQRTRVFHGIAHWEVSNRNTQYIDTVAMS